MSSTFDTSEWTFAGYVYEDIPAGRPVTAPAADQGVCLLAAEALVEGDMIYADRAGYAHPVRWLPGE